MEPSNLCWLKHAFSLATVMVISACAPSTPAAVSAPPTEVSAEATEILSASTEELPAPSPDSSLIFAVAWPDSSAFPGGPWGYLVTPDGSDMYPVTFATSSIAGGTWSPSGDALALIHYEQQAPHISIVPVNSTIMERYVTPLYNLPSEIKWSPSGEYISAVDWGYAKGFTANNEPRTAIYIHYAEYGNQLHTTDIEGRLADFQVAWSPDGSRVAFASWGSDDGTLGNQIFVMNADGSNLFQVTDASAFNSADHPYWLDENTLLFLGLPLDGSGGRYVFRMALGETATPLMYGGGYVTEFSVSPDGRVIVGKDNYRSIIVKSTDSGPADNFMITEMELDFISAASTLTWAPDSQRFALALTDTIRIINLLDGTLNDIPLRDLRFIAWQP